MLLISVKTLLKLESKFHKHSAWIQLRHFGFFNYLQLLYQHVTNKLNCQVNREEIHKLILRTTVPVPFGAVVDR